MVGGDRRRWTGASRDGLVGRLSGGDVPAERLYTARRWGRRRYRLKSRSPSVDGLRSKWWKPQARGGSLVGLAPVFGGAAFLEIFFEVFQGFLRLSGLGALALYFRALSFHLRIKIALGVGREFPGLLNL